MSDEELNRIMMKADDDLDKLKDRCHDLYEENKELKELCNKYEEEHNNVFQEWKRVIKANKEAIEYIKNKLNEKNKTIYENDINWLLSVLQR